MRAFRDGNTAGMFIRGDVAGGVAEATLTGAILPKQGDLESSYVSLWSRKGEVLAEHINVLLDDIGAESPVLYDRNTGDDFVGRFEVVPWTL